MDGYTALAVILVGMTALIALAITVCMVHGNAMLRRTAIDNHALEMAKLDKTAEQRNADQQQAEVRAAAAEAKAQASQYTSTEIRKCLETLKSPSVVVQR
jgi:hypothetical protein